MLHSPVILGSQSAFRAAPPRRSQKLFRALPSCYKTTQTHPCPLANSFRMNTYANQGEGGAPHSEISVVAAVVLGYPCRTPESPLRHTNPARSEVAHDGFFREIPLCPATFLFCDCVPHRRRRLLALLFQQTPHHGRRPYDSRRHRHLLDDHSDPTILADHPSEIHTASPARLGDSARPRAAACHQRTAHGPADDLPLRADPGASPAEIHIPRSLRDFAIRSFPCLGHRPHPQERHRRPRSLHGRHRPLRSRTRPRTRLRILYSGRFRLCLGTLLCADHHGSDSRRAHLFRVAPQKNPSSLRPRPWLLHRHAHYADAHRQFTIVRQFCQMVRANLRICNVRQFAQCRGTISRDSGQQPEHPARRSQTHRGLTIRGRCFEIRDQKQNGEQNIATRDEQIGRMNSALQKKNQRRNEIAQLLQNAHEHQRPESYGIRPNHQKYKLPRHADSRESVIEQWMRHRRRIFYADLVKNKKQRRQHQNSPNPRNIKKIFRKFHRRSRENVPTFKRSNVSTLFPRQQRAMARHALPQSIPLDPRIRISRPHHIRLALVRAGLAINSCHHRRVPVNLHVHSLVVKMIGLLVRIHDPLHVLLLVHERAVVIRVNQRIGHEIVHRADLLLHFGLVPGALQLPHLDFVGGARFVLRGRRGIKRQRDKSCQCEIFHRSHLNKNESWRNISSSRLPCATSQVSAVAENVLAARDTKANSLHEKKEVSLSRVFVPAVAHVEEDARVIARIVISEARVRVMHQIDAKIHRLLFTAKPVDSAAELRREIDLRRIARRHVRCGEERAACKLKIRNDAARRREVPPQNNRFHASAIHRSVRRENRVHRQNFDRVLKIAAHGTRPEKIRRQHSPDSSARIKELRVRRFSRAASAAGQQPKVPRVAPVLQRVHWRVSGGIRRSLLLPACSRSETHEQEQRKKRGEMETFRQHGNRWPPRVMAVMYN